LQEGGGDVFSVYDSTYPNKLYAPPINTRLVKTFLTFSGREQEQSSLKYKALQLI